MSIIDKVKNIKARRVARQLTVKSATNLTANMRRVTLHGDDLANFPANSEGAYIKLVFGEGANGKSTLLDALKYLLGNQNISSLIVQYKDVIPRGYKHENFAL